MARPGTGRDRAKADADRLRAWDEALKHAEQRLSQDPHEALVRICGLLSERPGDRRATALLTWAVWALGEEGWEEKARRLASVADLRDPRIREAAQLVGRQELAGAERIVRSVLLEKEDHPPALRLLAAIAARLDRLAEAEALLLRALALAPSYAAASLDLAGIWYRQNALEKALAELDRLLEAGPDDREPLMLKAAALSRLGRPVEAVAIYEKVTGAHPRDAGAWILLGHALRTMGRQGESIAAYRRALDISPQSGLAWYSLANLKTVSLGSGDRAAISTALAKEDLAEDDRIHLLFALSKAHEDQGDVGEAFATLRDANARVFAGSGYDPRNVSGQVERSCTLFDKAFFDQRAEWGELGSGVIFVLGMPRSGSTLVEQILASHPAVEGTAELPYVPLLARSLEAHHGEPYPDLVTRLDDAQVRALAADYLQRSRAHRRTDRPWFIDKNPPNWLHLGLIRMILPDARIIDVRRHPLACGVSNFRQHYAHGEGFAYSLEAFGLYYRDYLRMMRHFDKVAPGWVHRVSYEQLVAEPEAEIRLLLDALELTFEESCLRFHENERVVRTFSSEQVRRPLNRDGVEGWKAYERWLGPLREALGPDLPPEP